MAIEREEREACAREEGYWELTHRSGEGKKVLAWVEQEGWGGSGNLTFALVLPIKQKKKKHQQ